MACFADITVSQGSMTTCARCGEICNIHLTTNLPGNLPVKKLFLNRFRFDRMAVSLWSIFFGPPCICIPAHSWSSVQFVCCEQAFIPSCKRTLPAVRCDLCFLLRLQSENEQGRSTAVGVSSTFAAAVATSTTTTLVISLASLTRHFHRGIDV